MPRPRSSPALRPSRVPATRGGYTDLAARYRGPRVSELDPTANVEPVPLTYSPPDHQPYFTALVVTELDGEAAPLRLDDSGRPAAYTSSPCARDCIDVELGMLAAAGPVRIPVPTGHRLDVDSVRLDGERVPVYATANDEPALRLVRERKGRLIYRTGPATGSDIAVPPLAAGLPSALRREARGLRKLPVERRVQALLGIVQTRVSYSTSREVAAQHHRAILSGEEFVSRTLRIGAGDCDVQNGLLVAMLQAARVPARLAVGYVGQDGQVAPWLHAWAEYRDEQGNWLVADASSSPFASVDSPAIAVGPDAVGPTPIGPAPGPGDDPPEDPRPIPTIDAQPDSAAATTDPPIAADAPPHPPHPPSSAPSSGWSSACWVCWAWSSA